MSDKDPAYDTTEEKRQRLAEFEIEEVWESKDYRRLCEEEGEEPWASEEEIRAYFAELPDGEVLSLWVDSPFSDGEQMARHKLSEIVSNAYPDGWTCQGCSVEFFGIMPAGRVNGGTECSECSARS